MRHLAKPLSIREEMRAAGFALAISM